MLLAVEENQGSGWRGKHRAHPLPAIAVGLAAHIVEFSGRHFNELTPLSESSRDSVNFNQGQGTSPVSSLLLWRGPSAIIRFIISIIVNAIDGVVSRWSVAHVFNKRLKTANPSRADSDASAPIEGPFMVVGVSAPAFHRAPYFILRRLRHAMKVGASKSVGAERSCAILNRKTSATGCGFPYVRSGYTGNLPAVAFAHPHGVSFGRLAIGLGYDN